MGSGCGWITNKWEKFLNVCFQAPKQSFFPRPPFLRPAEKVSLSFQFALRQPQRPTLVGAVPAPPIHSFPARAANRSTSSKERGNCDDSSALKWQLCVGECGDWGDVQSRWREDGVSATSAKETQGEDRRLAHTRKYTSLDSPLDYA